MQSYDSNIRGEMGSMSAWTSAVNTVLIQLVAAQDPAYGTSLQAAVSYLYQAMLASGDTVLQYTLTSTVTADVGNVGIGSVFVTLIRGDGYSLQNTIPENATLLITADSYTGGATRGQEPWQYTGAPNVSSLGTGVGVGLWDWDNPQGSGASASGNCISASQYATGNGNILTNGDAANWTGSAPAVLNNWNLEIGTWGTSIIREAVQFLSSPYSIKFNTGATLNSLTQQFSTTASSGATAGTTVPIQPYLGYAFNLWLKAAGVVSGGVMTVSLVDSSGTVILDQKGTANSTTIALTGAPTSWTPHLIAFRTPVILPADGIVRLKVKITTALAGAALYMDDIAMCQPTNLYVGGPSIAVFSDASAPFEAVPEPDGWTIGLTNDYGGSTYHSSFQTLANRLWQIPGLILPYDPSPTISDTLITGA